jgi:hypothetical protein
MDWIMCCEIRSADCCSPFLDILVAAMFGGNELGAKAQVLMQSQ